MDKFKTKACELNNRIKTILDSFEIRKRADGWPNDYFAPDEVTTQFPDLALDVQLLFFSDSPENPLYISAIKLNERIEEVTKRYGDRFGYHDFIYLQGLLSKYSEYRDFLASSE